MSLTMYMLSKISIFVNHLSPKIISRKFDYDAISVALSHLFIQIHLWKLNEPA